MLLSGAALGWRAWRLRLHAVGCSGPTAGWPAGRRLDRSRLASGRGRRPRGRAGLVAAGALADPVVQGDRRLRRVAGAARHVPAGDGPHHRGADARSARHSRGAERRGANRSGTAVARVADVNSAEVWVSLDPKADYEETLAAMRTVVNAYPGVTGEVQTFLSKRMRESLTGEDEAITVRRLRPRSAASCAPRPTRSGRLLAKIDGVKNPKVEQQAEQQAIDVEVDLEKARSLRPEARRRAPRRIGADRRHHGGQPVPGPEGVRRGGLGQTRRSARTCTTSRTC